MTTHRCPLCFARDVDVVFLRHDPARDEYYCLQCAYAGSADEAERLLQTYRETRYKRRTASHPFAERRVAANAAGAETKPMNNRSGSNLPASPAPSGAAGSPATRDLPCPPDAADDFLSRPSPAVLATLARHPGPVLVLGAGGKIGLHVSAMVQRSFELAGRRDQVFAVSRFSTLRDRAAFESRGVTTLACDLADEAAVAGLPEAPTVFFLAGVKFGTSSDPDILRRMNVEMPRLVAERYRKARIVAFSTGCVYPFVRPDTGGATEATPVDPAAAAYAASCIARERAFADVSAAHGTPVALIRLNYAVEFRYGLLLDIAQKVMDGQPVDVGMGYVNVIWQSDAVEHSIQALDVAASPAVPVNVTGGEVLSVRQLAHHFGELLGRPAILTGKEAETAWLNDARWAHERFGAPRTALADMMRWTAAWVRDVGRTWGKPTGFERRDGRY